jgi:plastocyanin
VHVLNVSQILPHDQAFYDREGDSERTELLSDASRLEGRGFAAAAGTPGDEVSAGIAEIVGTGGGVHTSAVMRFQRETIIVRVGDTVEWTNLGAAVNHTVTFGVEPADLVPPSPGVTVDADGGRHAIISSPAVNVNSGFLGPAPQDRVGLAQSPAGVTRFRVTFTAPGTFNYICGLHDDLGMVGKVIVH